MWFQPVNCYQINFLILLYFEEIWTLLDNLIWALVKTPKWYFSSVLCNVHCPNWEQGRRHFSPLELSAFVMPARLCIVAVVFSLFPSSPHATSVDVAWESWVDDRQAFLCSCLPILASCQDPFNCNIFHSFGRRIFNNFFHFFCSSTIKCLNDAIESVLIVTHLTGKLVCWASSSHLEAGILTTRLWRCRPS